MLDLFEIINTKTGKFTVLIHFADRINRTVIFSINDSWLSIGNFLEGAIGETPSGWPTEGAIQYKAQSADRIYQVEAKN